MPRSLPKPYRLFERDHYRGGTCCPRSIPLHAASAVSSRGRRLQLYIDAHLHSIRDGRRDQYRRRTRLGHTVHPARQTTSAFAGRDTAAMSNARGRREGTPTPLDSPEEAMPFPSLRGMSKQESTRIRRNAERHYPLQTSFASAIAPRRTLFNSHISRDTRQGLSIWAMPRLHYVLASPPRAPGARVSTAPGSAIDQKRARGGEARVPCWPGCIFRRRRQPSPQRPRGRSR